jgi:hypothetical protein
MSISGKYLTAAINGVNIEGTHEWSFKETADRLEATTGADQGRGKKDLGVIDGNVRIVFYFDIATGVYEFIRPGSQIVDLALYHDGNAATPLVLIADAQVFDATVRGQVRDRMIVEAEIEPYGDVVTVTDPA